MPTQICGGCLQEGDVLAIPAFLFEWLCNEHDSQQITNYITAGATLISSLKGVGIVVRAPTAVNRVLFAINTINTANLFVPMDRIIEDNLGNEVAMVWQVFTAVAKFYEPMRAVFILNSISTIELFIAAWDGFKYTDEYRYLTRSSSLEIEKINELVELTRQMITEHEKEK